MRKVHSHPAWQSRLFWRGPVWLGVVGVVILIGAVGAMAQEETAEQTEVSGYMRVDTDKYGTQIWFGATHPCRGLDIVSDVFLVNSTAEFDVGPSLSLGEELTLSPMAGLVFDFASTNLTTLAPQLYIYWTANKWYLESWENVYFGLKDEYRPHYFSDRTFLLYSLSDAFSLGPHAEVSLNLEDTPGDTTGGVDKLTSLVVGGVVNLNYGKDNSLMVFLGRETKKEDRDGNDGIAGRVTFIRQW